VKYARIATVPHMSNAMEQLPGVISHTDPVAIYCRKRFEMELVGDTSPLGFPSGWTIEFLHECNQLVMVLVAAHEHQSLYCSYTMFQRVAHLWFASINLVGCRSILGLSHKSSGRTESRVRTFTKSAIPTRICRPARVRK
jgi:hypothetical protein